MAIGPEDTPINFTPSAIGAGITSGNGYVIEYEDPDNSLTFIPAKTQSEGTTDFQFTVGDSTFPLEVGTTLTAYILSNAPKVRVRITSGDCSGTFAQSINPVQQ